MLDTKLILIEGLPGAGKSTTTKYLQEMLRQRGFDCRGFLEEDRPHPIDCIDFEIKGLPDKVIPLWENFVELASREPTITILESRLWQSTGLYMYMSEAGEEEIVTFTHQVYQLLAPLSPILIYLDQSDTATALRRLYTLRGEAWMDATLEETLPYPWFLSRGLNDFTGWVKFFEEWKQIAGRLYDDWRGHKIKTLSSHEDWENNYRQINSYLQVE